MKSQPEFDPTWREPFPGVRLEATPSDGFVPLNDCGQRAMQTLLEEINSVLMQPVTQDFLFHPDSLRALMNWSSNDLQEAINDGRVCLINWEEGGQSVCLPGSRWIKTKPAEPS